LYVVSADVHRGLRSDAQRAHDLRRILDVLSRLRRRDFFGGHGTIDQQRELFGLVKNRRSAEGEHNGVEIARGYFVAARVDRSEWGRVELRVLEPSRPCCIAIRLEVERGPDSFVDAECRDNLGFGASIEIARVWGWLEPL